MKWQPSYPVQLSILGLLLGSGIFLGLSGFGVAMEDAAIHLAMAKGLFSEGFFSLTSGIPAGAVTSPLWIVLEAIPLALTGSPTAAATCLSIGTAILLARNIWLFLRRILPGLPVHSSHFASCRVPFNGMYGVGWKPFFLPGAPSGSSEMYDGVMTWQQESGSRRPS